MINAFDHFVVETYHLIMEVSLKNKEKIYILPVFKNLAITLISTED